MTQASQRPSASSVKLDRSARPRAPLVGIVLGVVMAGGLALWTFQRIGEAKTMQSEVESRRSADSQRATALAREPMKVGVLRGAADTWQPRVELDGTLQGQHEASLGFKVGGRLGRVNVEVGDRVKAGAVLGQLDLVEAAAQASAAEAHVRAAEATLGLAQDGERRTLPLVQSGSFAEATGVQATQQRQLAVAQLDSARAQLALARAGMNSHTLSAPFSGTITQAPTGIGAVVAPGQTLFGLVDTSTLKLATTVSEADANLLAKGIEIRVATERGELAGRVTAILTTLDPRTRRVPVVAEFDNDVTSGGPALRAGAFVRAWVTSKDAIPVLRVPHGVLRPGSQDEVLIVKPSSSQLEVRRIVFAVAPDGALLVRRGLEPGDDVVLDPIPESKAGDLVRAEPVTPKGTDPTAVAASETGAAASPVAPGAAAAKAGTP